jgi:hypothetical protein
MSYWIVILGMVLGGLALLVIYILLAMAQKGDTYYDQLEMEQPWAGEYVSLGSKKGEIENLVAPATFDLYHGSTT